MSLGLWTITSALKSLINSGLTSTAINSGLATSVQYLDVGDARTFPIANNLYPAILLRLTNKEEDFSQMGNSAKRYIGLEYEIIPVTYQGMVSGGGASKAHEELYRLVSNIEAYLRTKPDLSMTACYESHVGSTSFEAIKNDETYCHTAVIRLSAKFLSE